MKKKTDKTAVILFNLGGPDNQESIKPFLFNLFFDPAIISLPKPLRWVLAKAISRRRSPEASRIYAQIGGGSPILKNTEAQSKALQDRLGGGYRCFMAMRYWHPRASQTLEAVRAYAPDQIVLLPLYPQFSTTTTGSSLNEWHQLARAGGVHIPTESIRCYPTAPGFVAAYAVPLIEALERFEGPVRVLFSAHGLPESIIEKGDPYRDQVIETARAIVTKVEASPFGKSSGNWDWRVTFQSRVGPKRWTSPYTDAEIKVAGTEERRVVIVPLAFVSEHSETLVELDITYKALAEKSGVPRYDRLPTPGSNPLFIDALATLVQNATANRDRKAA